MKYLVIFAIVATAFAAPAYDDATIEFYSDNAGLYKYTFKSINITITEEREHSGFVKGAFSYIDEYGIRQTVTYTSGVQGFIAQGTTLPVNTNTPVEDLPEVVEARKKHLAISEAIRNVLPELKEDGTVEEKPIVPLTDAELFEAVSKSVNSKELVFSEDTSEVANAKKEFLEFYKQALGH